jgi:ABC-type Fe3+-hydroxamate transport system substrate-binding protein
MSDFIDHLGRKITLNSVPSRIISTVPSQTELLHDLGLEDEVVGITKFCIHPKIWFQKKIRIGGTKHLNIERIQSLHPDLIIANKEENTKEDIEALTRIAPVWISDIKTVQDALDMIATVGTMVNKADAAQRLIKNIKTKLDLLIKPEKVGKVLYVIWLHPIMVAASDTFINAMLQELGYENAAKHLSRYPTISEQDVAELKPDHIFLSSEPFPFKEKHIGFFKNLVPQARVRLVDGELFSWYGSRLLKIDELAKSLLNQT